MDIGMAWPLLMICARLRVISWVDRVTTKGNMLNFEIRKPLIKPNMVATPTAMMQASTMFMPPLLASAPSMQLTRASWAPTVSSMPPVVMARHMPKASRQLTEICVSIFSRFAGAMNLGWMMATMMIITSSTSVMPYLLRNMLNLS